MQCLRLSANAALVAGLSRGARLQLPFKEGWSTSAGAVGASCEALVWPHLAAANQPPARNRRDVLPRERQEPPTLLRGWLQAAQRVVATPAAACKRRQTEAVCAGGIHSRIEQRFEGTNASRRRGRIPADGARRQELEGHCMRRLPPGPDADHPLRGRLHIFVASWPDQDLSLDSTVSPPPCSSPRPVTPTRPDRHPPAGSRNVCRASSRAPSAPTARNDDKLGMSRREARCIRC